MILGETIFKNPKPIFKHVIIGSLVGEKMTMKSQIGPILLCDIMKEVV